ncbi:MAG: hypothetical protein SAL07_20755 [Oscillatoria sp. PMC 1051.18]|nr:hypothetical protein [Oscillatoria sp. PMC 1050.18]MEC5032338.1 hypothetical protein [Oscillatoria sp. PMC 1051.18]
MNSNNFLELLQKGFLATVGATASAIETWQDEHQREAILSQLSNQLEQKVREWTEKGKLTEQEARKIIDGLFNRQSSSTATTETTPTSKNVPIKTEVGDPQVDAELRSLIEQIVALRTELENLRSGDPSK